MSNLIAVSNSAPLSLESGGTIGAGSIVVIAAHEPMVQLNYDEDGAYDGTFVRKVTFDLCVYENKSMYQADPANCVKGSFADFNVGYEKVVDQTEWDAFMAAGSIIYTWVKDYLNAISGNTATLVDPYTI